MAGALPSPRSPRHTQVQVFMVKDIGTGHWERRAEWVEEGSRGAESERRSTRAALPTPSLTPRPRAASPSSATAERSPQRGTFGLAARPSNRALPAPPRLTSQRHTFTIVSAAQSARMEERDRQKVADAVTRQREAHRGYVFRTLTDFERKLMIYQPRAEEPRPLAETAKGGSFSLSPANSLTLTATISPEAPPLQSGPRQSVTSGGRRLTHPLVGLLCTHSAPELVHAFREFCVEHTMPSLPNAGLGSSTETGDPLNQSMNAMPSELAKEVYQRVESGWFFYIHPDGMTLPQFKFLMPHLTAKTNISIGSDSATHMFRLLCRDTTRKLPFSDIFTLYCEALLPKHVRQNVDFVLQCFDPHGVGRVPNHMFYSRFVAKFLQSPTCPVPITSMPQWNLLLELLKQLEDPHHHAHIPRPPSRQSHVLHTPRKSLVGPPPELDGASQDFLWLRTAYINAAQNYKTFTDKMSLMMSTIRARVQRGLETSASVGGLQQSTAPDPAQTQSPGSTALGREWPVTIAVPLADAKVVLLGCQPLYELFLRNNFIFYKPPPPAPLFKSPFDLGSGEDIKIQVDRLVPATMALEPEMS